MTLFRTLFTGLAAIVLVVLLSLSALAEPVMTPVCPKPQTRPSLFFPMAAQIGQQLQSLVGASTGTSTAPTTAPATNQPAATPAPANTNSEANSDDSDTTPQATFGIRALNLVLSTADLLRAQGVAFITNFAALPDVSDWIDQQRSDPKAQKRWNTISYDFMHVVVIAFLSSLALGLLMLPLRFELRRRTPSDLRRRLVVNLALLGIRLLPVLVFVGIALILLDQTDNFKIARYVTLSIIYAITLCGLTLAILRGVLSPSASALRIVPATDGQAVYAYLTLKLFSLVIILGYFFIDVARAMRVPSNAVSAFSNVLGLILVLMTMLVIVQKRSFVSVLLRGNLSAASPDLSVIESFRLWFARRWHILATIYLIIGYGVTISSADNGFAILLRGTILTLLVLVVMRYLLHGIDHWKLKRNSSESIEGLHHPILRFCMRLAVWVIAIITIFASWGADITALFATSFGQRVAGAAISISVTIIIVTIIYETFNSAIERHLNRRDSEGRVIPSARVRTLLPMIRNTAFIALTGIIGLVVLSAIGVNIAPLLAGAGVIGVAVGFGSQALIKDFLTGLFIVLENTIAIGDVVKIGDHSGVVETMSIRTLKLRDGDGALHILPFSEVTKIINMTRDYSFAVVNVGVAYDSDLDKVMAVIRDVGDELQKDPIWKRVILEPVEIQGVDSFNDSSITIAARVRTRAGKQWDVKRMFLLKLKQRFDKEGIEIPFPTVMSIQRPHNPGADV